MTYRLLVFSEEETGFVMEILAQPTTTFLELHHLIQDACGYTEEKNHIFLVCDENWKVQEKVHLNNVNTLGYDEDLYLMKDTFLEDLIEEEGHHMAYTFDATNKRKLIIELVENLFDKKVPQAIVNRQKGQPPIQFENNDVETLPNTSTPPLPNTEDTDNYDVNEEDNFSEDEIDMEGFEVSNH